MLNRMSRDMDGCAKKSCSSWLHCCQGFYSVHFFRLCFLFSDCVFFYLVVSTFFQQSLTLSDYVHLCLLVPPFWAMDHWFVAVHCSSPLQSEHKDAPVKKRTSKKVTIVPCERSGKIRLISKSISEHSVSNFFLWWLISEIHPKKEIPKKLLYWNSRKTYWQIIYIDFFYRPPLIRSFACVYWQNGSAESPNWTFWQ